jgi:hypothetical protein
MTGQRTTLVCCFPLIVVCTVTSTFYTKHSLHSTQLNRQHEVHHHRRLCVRRRCRCVSPHSYSSYPPISHLPSSASLTPYISHLTPPSRQNATSTITIKPACPTGMPADVMVTRSGVVVPSCAAGNGTKPMIMSTGAMGSATNSAGMPVFTGAAGKTVVDSFAAIVGFGVVAGLVL